MSADKIVIKLKAEDKLKILKKVKRESSLLSASRLKGRAQLSEKAYKRRPKHKSKWLSDF